jgi:transposase
MQHVAIDLGGRESQICVRSSSGAIEEEKRWPTARLVEWLEKQPKSRVIVETCSEAFAIADGALAAGHEVRVVPAALVRSLGVGSRRTKTDRRDAQILSEVSCRIDLPSVHIASPLARRRKSLCGMREALVGARTQLVNTVRGWLRGEARGPLRSGGVEQFTKRVRTRYEEGGLPGYIERQLKAIDDLCGHIAAADEELERLAKKDEECRRLMTVPGVGPVTALRFAAAVDEVGRFDGAHKLEAYLGLVPGEHSSSERTRRTGITKAGPPALRRTLVEAAWASRRARGSHPMVHWALEIQRRRGPKVASLALARKMAGILYAILRDGTSYDPKRGKRDDAGADYWATFVAQRAGSATDSN